MINKLSDEDRKYLAEWFHGGKILETNFHPPQREGAVKEYLYYQDNQGWRPIANFDTDLNAMYEVEKELIGLDDIYNNCFHFYSGNIARLTGWPLHADAYIRALAMVKTIKTCREAKLLK